MLLIGFQITAGGCIISVKPIGLGTILPLALAGDPFLVGVEAYAMLLTTEPLAHIDAPIRPSELAMTLFAVIDVIA